MIRVIGIGVVILLLSVVIGEESADIRNGQEEVREERVREERRGKEREMIRVIGIALLILLLSIGGEESAV